MNYVKWLAASAALAAAGAANAGEFSSTITAASEYDFRGFSQSAKDPALQGSLDYAFDNGFAIGAWASNVDFEPLDGDIELDLYASYSADVSDTLSWNVGAVYYLYPGSDDVTVDLGGGETEVLPAIGEYWEAYVGLNVGPVALKQWYADDLYEAGESGLYTEANAAFPFGESGFSLLAHVGYSWGDYWDDAGGEIFDYSVGVGYDFSNFSLALKYTGTDASGDQKITDDVANNEGRVVFTIATTLPWGE
jgi:uncharacterized protein (TIGR02001 family)